VHFTRGFVSRPQLAADCLQNRPRAHRPVQNHQAKLGTIKVQVASTPLDYLVTAFVSCDFSLCCSANVSIFVIDPLPLCGDLVADLRGFRAKAKGQHGVLNTAELYFC
jgi:hypothetical protein